MNSKPPPSPRVSYRLPLREKVADDVSGPEPWESSLLPLLRENAVWFCRLRWVVVAILALGGLLAYFNLPTAGWGIRLTIGWPLTTAAILAAFNLAYIAVLPHVKRQREIWPVRLLLWVQIVVDLVVLTAVVHFMGSVESVAPFMYLFHIVLACIFFPLLESLAVTLVAALLYLMCFLLERMGFIDPVTFLLGAAPGQRGELPDVFWAVQIGSTFAVWGVIWYLASRLAGALRHREHDLAATNYRLEKSSEERVQHMLQTTHQMKAPFAAIQSNAQLLLGGFSGTLPEKAIAVVQRIVTRCEMLRQQIVDMLQLANLRSQSPSLPPCVGVDLVELIEASIARVEPTARRRGIQVETELEPLVIRAVEDHVRMLVDNLLSNAVNYSLDGGIVTLTCHPAGSDAVILTVRDRGIGIPADKIEKIFQDYYRTSEAVQHNNASTGLGLAIVRQVATAAGVAVQVESGPGWGTRFSLTIPKNSPASPAVDSFVQDKDSAATTDS